MKVETPLTSRLELRPIRMAQVKDAGRAATGAHKFVRDLAARLRTPRCAVLIVTLLMLLVPATNAASAQAAGPEWKLTVTPNADYFLPGPTDLNAAYTVEAENVGEAPTSGEVTLQLTLPAGRLSGRAVQFYYSGHRESSAGKAFPAEGRLLDLSEALCPTSLKCKFPGSEPFSVQPGERLIMIVALTVGATEGPLATQVRVFGGGPAEAKTTAATEVNAAPPFGFHDFTAPLTDSSGHPYTQAGGHPEQLVTEFDPSTVTDAEFNGEGGTSLPVRDPKDITVALPPGLIGNPGAVPSCALAEFFARECRLSTAVGTVGVRFEGQSRGGLRELGPLYNLLPTGQFPGELGFQGAFPYLFTASVRSGSDYGLALTSAGTAEAAVNRVRVTTWGVPAAPEHDSLRGKLCDLRIAAELGVTPTEQLERECAEAPVDGDPVYSGGGPAETPERPFLTLPTHCTGEALTGSIRSNSWQLPGEYAEKSTTMEAVDGCSSLHFEPSITAHPTTNLADSPSGFEFDLHLPQKESEEDVEGTEQAQLRDATVTLPPGLVVNPSSANGLAACSEAQVGFLTAAEREEPAHCPDAAKLGTVEVDTSLLNEPLTGSVYLAAPHQNPSGSLLAGYIVLEGQGLVIKLPGKFETNPQTGQLTGSFEENPQLPFEDFKLKFFEGAQGALRTPPTCGAYEVHSTLTPWSAPESGPPATPHDKFETTRSAQGGACPSSEPNSPVFHAGTESPQAGIYSPFSLKLVREDGSQELSKIETTLPPGLVGKLAGISYCPDAALATAADKSGAAEQASPSCPASSEVGTVDVAAGAGPTPLHVPGHAYLAGPYKSAPLSLAIITPAVAGPFDLGTVVVRTALYVNPETAQIHAVSDPIPTILEGIPLDVRSITLKMARPNFTLNPTNCNELGFTGAATSLLGNVAPLAQRFQVGGCPALGFKPGLKISLKGGTKRHQFPALKAVVTYPKKGSYANIAKAQVTLPHSAFLEQGHIKTVCTRPQLASQTCPAASIYGKATAITPLLDKPLSGPVYLGVGFGNKLPDLVAELDGQIRVLLAGKVDTGKEDGLRNSFELVPDAPVSKFTLEMSGGKKGLIVNSENLCSPKAKTKAVANFTGQNGKTYDIEPTVANSCKKGKGKKSGKGHKHHKSHRLGTSHR